MTIEDAGRKLRAREVSAVELARGFDRGPLHGIQYALKDAFTTRGIRTTLGSKIFADYIPDYDSTVYEKLRAAGAVLMGKTGLHELAYGITSNNPHFGAIRNPRDPERIPGGSSGGSGAAVAAEIVFFAMGTDRGGSIRIPAAFCGCVGLKPTYGLVDRHGMMPLSFSLDHAGPLTRSVRDAELVMRALVHFPEEETGRAIEGLWIGVPRNFFIECVSPSAEAAFAQALSDSESRGGRLVPITVPDPGEINAVGRMILLSEASALMEPYMNRRGDFGADVLSLLDQGRLVSATDYINARRLRGVYRRQWSDIWEKCDVVFTPTAPIEAPRIGESILGGKIGVAGEDVRLAATRFVRSFNVLGFPVISIPLHKSGLPAGLQIVSRAGGDQELLAVAGKAISPKISFN